MRIAVLVIALFCAAVIGFQSCAASVLGTLAEGETSAAEGALGGIVMLLYVAGAGFVINYPKTSINLFAFAGALAIIPSIFGFYEYFKDLIVWGVLAFVLSYLCSHAAGELNKENLWGFRHQRDETNPKSDSEPEIRPPKGELTERQTTLVAIGPNNYRCTKCQFVFRKTIDEIQLGYTPCPNCWRTIKRIVERPEL